jgi:hypothetical protein
MAPSYNSVLPGKSLFIQQIPICCNVSLTPILRRVIFAISLANDEGVMMKKKILIAAVLVLLIFLPGLAFGQTENWESHFDSGDISLSAGVGAAIGSWGFGFTAYPGAELTLLTWEAGGVVPLSFGIALRGMIGFSSYYGFAYGAGAFATIHFGFKGLDIPQWVQDLDLYGGLGVAFSVSSRYTSGYGFGINSYGGFNYFLSEKLALQVEANYWGYYYSNSIGVLLKL